MRFFAFALLLALTSACAGDNNPGTGTGDPMNPNPPQTVEGYLEIVGPRVLLTEVGGELELNVRYIDNRGNPLQGAISFAIEGAAAGASLDATMATTNAEGIATVRVRAGMEATFPVVAVAPLANDPATITVQVSGLATSELTIIPRYSGDRDFDNVEVALFTNLRCADLEGTVPSPRALAETGLDREVRFADLQAGVPLAVYGFGLNDAGNVAAAACADHMINDDVTQNLTLVDVPFVRAGRYETVETFDVTAGFSDGLNNVLDAITGLSSDPAAYIVDTALASVDLPTWARNLAETPAIRDEIEDYLNDTIADLTLPSELEAIGELGTDVDMAFTNLSFVGTLNLGEAGEFGNAAATHTLTEVRVPTSAGVASFPLSGARADLEVEFNETVVLPSHSFEVSFGRVVETLINQVLLPRLPGEPHSVNELVSGLINCDGLAARVDPDGGLAADAAQAACMVGVGMISDRIQDELVSLWSYETLTLEGTGTVNDLDDDYITDEFRGTADANWSGDSGELDFSGTIVGTRDGDVAPPRAKEVRDRIRGLI